MISANKFQAGLKLLQTHFNKQLSEDAIAIWFEYLDNELDDDQFTAAVKEAVLSCEFIPTPKKLVEMATKSQEVKAMEEWRTVLRLSAWSEDHQRANLHILSRRARTALQIVGGFRAVGYAEEGFELSRLEKKFITAYTECSLQDRALPPAQVQPVEYDVIDEPKIKLTGNKPEPIKKILEGLERRIEGKEISEQQLAFDMFALKWKWHIDQGRLSYYLAMDMPSKQQFLSRFGYAMRNNPSWKSAVVHFDCITGYQAQALKAELDARAIAQEWLQDWK